MKKINHELVHPALKAIIKIAIFLVAIFATYELVNLIVPSHGSLLTHRKFASDAYDKTVNYVAIGDSLTEGVGDLTNQGGFVPLFAREISDYQQANVEAQNYGVAGNTSTQILKRIKKQKEIQTNLKVAQVITLTVGGNDLMHAIQKDFMNLSVEIFEEPRTTYKKNLNTLINEIRRYNESAPIFVLGIYNPFYIAFSEVTEMQTVVDQWNQATADMVAIHDKTYFVPINDLIYKGIDGKAGVVDGSATNDALYEEDRFHPNNTGYQIMSDAVFSTYKEEVPQDDQ
jgi:lysophospholipase L1-like esterase